MNCFTDDQVARITHLVNEIEKLSDVEKLFLYLQLPCGQADKEDFGELTHCRVRLCKLPKSL